MTKNKIYLDYSATTPVDPLVFKAMQPYFFKYFGNPMTIHSFGVDADKAVEKAREQLAEFFNCTAKEVVFTSGATESNNLAISGAIRFYGIKKNKKNPHIITTKIEHKSVLENCRVLENEGVIEVTYLPVTKDGIVRVEDVVRAIKENTILVSVMCVNNEIGTVQPIKEIGAMIKRYNKQEKKKLLFHTDATQAVNYFDCSVRKLNVDLLSLSGHKIYGPKGVGALFVKSGTPLKSIINGGGQENRMRAGTHNVPGIVGLGEAVKLVESQKSKVESLTILKLRDYLIKKILKEIPDSHLNGSKVKRSPNNANFRFDNVEGESIIMSLDFEGIAAGTGSACSSGALAPSHVLLALGLKHEQAHGSLRLALGKHTTKKEIDTVITKLKSIIKRLRKISGDVLDEFK